MDTFTYVHKKDARYKAKALAISNLFIDEWVRLEQIKQGQLTRTKLPRKVWVIRECTS